MLAGTIVVSYHCAANCLILTGSALPRARHCSNEPRRVARASNHLRVTCLRPSEHGSVHQRSSWYDTPLRSASPRCREAVIFQSSTRDGRCPCLPTPTSRTWCCITAPPEVGGRSSCPFSAETPSHGICSLRIPSRVAIRNRLVAHSSQSGQVACPIGKQGGGYPPRHRIGKRSVITHLFSQRVAQTLFTSPDR